MEDNGSVRRRAKRAAFLIGFMTFLGFSTIMFILDGLYRTIFAPYLILGYIMFIPVGLFESFIFGSITYFIFKFIRNRLIYTISIITGIIICFTAGLFSQIYVWRSLSKTPPYKNEIDTNQNGKIDKWVYHDDLSIRVELDANYDGKPDIKEYYKNGELFKRELDINFDGKIDKIENYKK